jgi:hypothetical protein
VPPHHAEVAAFAGLARPVLAIAAYAPSVKIGSSSTYHRESIRRIYSVIAATPMPHSPYLWT